MFAVVVAGRLPLTLGNGGATQVDSTHLVFPLERAAEINHVTVFMTGETAFPAGYSATVHFSVVVDAAAATGAHGSGSMSSSSSSSSSTATMPNWKLLGCLRNDKPSAVFRVKGLATPSAANSNLAQIGISVEPDSSVEAQMAAMPSASSVSGDSYGGGGGGGGGGQLVKAGQNLPPAPIDTNQALALAPKIANNIFSFLSSFAPDSASQTVPLLQKWLEQFERKLRMQGSEFLDRQG
ncbi:unnamed protein product [Parajaminaea phylloscopi]